MDGHGVPSVRTEGRTRQGAGPRGSSSFGGARRTPASDAWRRSYCEKNSTVLDDSAVGLSGRGPRSERVQSTCTSVGGSHQQRTRKRVVGLTIRPIAPQVSTWTGRSTAWQTRISPQPSFPQEGECRKGAQRGPLIGIQKLHSEGRVDKLTGQPAATSTRAAQTPCSSKGGGSRGAGRPVSLDDPG